MQTAFIISKRFAILSARYFLFEIEKKNDEHIFLYDRRGFMVGQCSPRTAMLVPAPSTAEFESFLFYFLINSHSKVDKNRLEKPSSTNKVNKVNFPHKKKTSR